MTWIEILWWSFWALVARRQHERPFWAEFTPALIAPARCRAAWKETACGSIKAREPQGEGK